MYENLGLNWAASIPAFLSLLCVPMPFVFWKYGPAIRERCKYAKEAADFMKKMQNQTDEDDDDESAEGESGTQSEESADKEKEHEEEREEEIHEALDESYKSADEQPRIEPIRTKSAKRPGALRRTTSYDDSPFDLDRTNTRSSFRYERYGNTSRSMSKSSMASK